MCNATITVTLKKGFAEYTLLFQTLPYYSKRLLYNLERGINFNGVYICDRAVPLNTCGSPIELGDEVTKWSKIPFDIFSNRTETTLSLSKTIWKYVSEESSWFYALVCIHQWTYETGEYALWFIFLLFRTFIHFSKISSILSPVILMAVFALFRRFCQLFDTNRKM